MDFFKSIGDSLSSFGNTAIALFSSLIALIVAVVGKLGYLGIVLLMGLESSFFPFPSEIVVPPAGYLASTGQMNLAIVIICGIFGSILGALLNYYIALYLGRAVIIKYARFFFLTEDRFVRFENFFNKHGEITTFAGRLIPGIRQYISFPAGLVKMNIFKFILFTALGSGIWVTILAFVGYFVGSNQQLINDNLHIITYILLLFIFIVVAIYIGVQYFKKRRKTIGVK